MNVSKQSNPGETGDDGHEAPAAPSAFSEVVAGVPSTRASWECLEILTFLGRAAGPTTDVSFLDSKLLLLCGNLPFFSFFLSDADFHPPKCCHSEKSPSAISSPGFGASKYLLSAHFAQAPGVPGY